MKDIVERIESALIESGFVYCGDTDPYHRPTPAGTCFYIRYDVVGDRLEIGYGITPGTEQIGVIAALCDCSQCLKFTLHIDGNDVEKGLADAAHTIKEFFDAHAFLSPEELGERVKARREHFYSLVTDTLAPFGFVRKWPDRQQWLLDPENRVYIEIKMETAPALAHNMLVVVRDNRDADNKASYWRNVPINDCHRIFWEDMCDEYILNALKYAIENIILPVMRAGAEKLIDRGYFLDDKGGWAAQKRAPEPSALLDALTAAVEKLGLRLAEDKPYGYCYYVRYDSVSAFCINIDKDGGGLRVYWGMPREARIYKDIDPIKRVGAHHSGFEPCFKQLISSEADIAAMESQIKKYIRAHVPLHKRLRAWFILQLKGNR